MKFGILLLVQIMCFGCSTQEVDPNPDFKNGLEVTARTVNSEADSIEQKGLNNYTPQTISTNNFRKLGDFRIEVYEDNKLISRLYFFDGLLTKEITFNVESSKEEYVIEYFYTKNKEFEKLKVTKGDASILEDIFSQSTKRLEVQSDFLQSKGIGFPLADIVANDLSDLANVFSVADNYSDFKTETETDGNLKVIKFIGFNKTSRFHNSPIAFLSGNGDFVKIKDYELRLNNGIPQKEIYRIPDGSVTKIYSYKNGKLTDLVYQFTDLQNQTFSLRKRFEYGNL